MIISSSMILAIGSSVILIINLKAAGRKLKLKRMKQKQKLMIEKIRRDLQRKVEKEMTEKASAYLGKLPCSSSNEEKKEVGLVIRKKKKQDRPT